MNKMTTTSVIDGVMHEHETTDDLEIYKWVAEAMIYRHRGSKDITRITYAEKYDGYIHATFYISNGTKVKVDMRMGV